MTARAPVLALVGASFAAACLAAAGPPLPVSPGAADRFAGVGSPCPTFSWTAVDGAEGYELVVYRVPRRQTEAPEGSAPVLRARIPAGASTWTPAAEECLELDGSYVWLVRAEGAGVEGGWSESRLFRVDVDAVLGEMGPVIRRAIERELVRREPERRGQRPRRGGFAATSAAAARPAGAPQPAPAVPGERVYYSRGERYVGPPPEPRGVFTDEVELWLAEAGSGSSDKVQLVFATPEFDGSPSDAWAIIVEAEDSSTAGADAGTMSFSTPSFFDALQLFTDGTAIIGDLREFRILPSSSPPLACTSFLQEGMLYWDSTIGALCACDGSSWAPVDADETGSCV